MASPADAPSTDPSPSPVEAVDRALRVLEALAAAGPHGASLAELAAGLGLNKTTIHRTLAALRHRGFAMQEPSGRYALGPAATRLGDDYFGEENLPVLLHPALVALSREVDELVHLGVLSGREVVYLDKVEPERPVRVWSAIGRRSPAVTTALGRALLAHRGTDRAALAGYLAAADVDPAHVWAVLERARRDGFATEVEENEAGISCVAVPLLRGGAAVAAVSVTAPADRMTGERFASLRDRMADVLPPLLPAGLTLP
ncbi:IclR family transcriptional regulator [Actinotalea ferrariae]|uniref:IclR family transcriptional regulator n=1 Tax=Actinotalea ferrariae TaxID=1386098 RepID=UPI001C8CC1A7|nr:IclR family transcriptional regulator [Actinotalea ferrariae]MBX9245004.1 IclR family transcriptional regulator [Actinotalea ferrariae]